MTDGAQERELEEEAKEEVVEESEVVSDDLAAEDKGKVLDLFATDLSGDEGEQ